MQQRRIKAVEKREAGTGRVGWNRVGKGFLSRETQGGKKDVVAVGGEPGEKAPRYPSRGEVEH